MCDAGTARAVMEVQDALASLSWLLVQAGDERPPEIAGGLGVVLGMLGNHLQPVTDKLLRVG